MIKPRYQASPVTLDLIKRFEGYRRTAAQLADGRWTIGYGHTKTARQGAEVSEVDASALLIWDLMEVAAVVNAVVFTPLSQNQFDALVSFAFNIGPENFRHSAVLRRINEGALLDAAFALEQWRKADFDGERIVVDALVRRRAAEKALFLKPQDGWVAAPSPVVEPKVDHGLTPAAPQTPAAVVAAPLDGPIAAQVHLDEDAMSPPQQAAANLAARLQLLAPESPPAPSEPEPFPELAPAKPPPTPAPAFAPPQPPPASNVEALRRSIFGEPEPKSAAEVQAERAGYWPLTLLGVAGLLVFAAAIVWAFHARPTGSAAAPLNIGVVVVGFIGILCVASAVYFALEKRAGRDQ